MIVMANKKKKSGQHKTPRKPVQFPIDWLAVAQGIASERPMPLMWYLVELIKKDAEQASKKNLPPLPWSLPKTE
jgi:hypothetical protein